MFEQHFASYLLEKQHITKSQFDLLMEQHQSTRVKLGLIAVAQKLLTNEQADQLHALQRQTDRRFGDLAVEKGYLSPQQVEELLEMQGNSYLRLVQILSENSILSLAEIEDFLQEYQVDQGFSSEQIQVLKSGDLQSILPLLVRTDNPLANQYISLALRNIIRFIHNQPLLGTMTRVTSYSKQNLALQAVIGDHDLWLGCASDDDSLIEIASPFAREEFSQMDEDAFDAVCEFLNCVNGLFSTELSHKDITVDMEPPSFATGQKIQSAKGLYVVPITINGRHFDLLAAIDDQLQLEIR